jgi:FAD/FMN-containing dehydrogenase/Fe-S oxidoreductase
MSLSPDFISELKKHFRGDVRADPASRILYSTDASIYQIVPLGVAIPQTQDDLIAAVELAAKYRVPILPRGSGSSLAGQAVGEALIIDCSRWLDRIIEINAEEKSAIFEPGAILASLNKAAAKHGLMFGPDPASAERATMGGVIGNNATGAHSILYGMTADHMLAADVIMSDGSLASWSTTTNHQPPTTNYQPPTTNDLLSSFIFSSSIIREKYSQAIKDHYPRTWRNSAGYRLNYLIPWSPSAPPQWHGEYPNLQSSTFNLSTLLAGSEGTLAVIRSAKVNLVRKPKHTALAVLAYDSIAASCDAVPDLLKHNPSAIELIPQMLIRLAKNVPAFASQVDWVRGDPAALIAVEFAGDDPDRLIAQARAVGADLIAPSASDQAKIWAVRKMGLGILDSRASSARTIAFIEDCAIPVERLGDFVRGVERIMSDHDTHGAFYAHASAGCLHVRPILNLKTPQGKKQLRSIAEAALALVISLGGSMSSEHGDGISHSEFLKQIYGEEVVEAFRLLKVAADPHNILNPGKIIDPPKMDAHLRYDETYETRAWTPVMDFSAQNGLVGAIEQCNGQGVCRKFDGVMCPSFQATREESNSTRGRANLLRAIISGNLEIVNRKSDSNSPCTIHSEAVFPSLDLCLACKGCKSECPSGVDMAKIKFAFMEEYYKTHRRPLRDYLFGYFHVVSAIASPFAPLVNGLLAFAPTKKLIAKIAGITDQRPFPKYKNVTVTSKVTITSRKKILFLRDPFTHYIEPQVEQAALNILSKLGYEVIFIPQIGSGVSLLSKGFVAEARSHALKVLESIQKLDPDRACAIVGVEPPEMYAIKNDYEDLLSDQDIASVKSRTWLMDEWLLRSAEFDRLRVFSMEKRGGQTFDVQREINFQPHCHQRAEKLADDGKPSGVNATTTLLTLCGFDVRVIESGCCGMAGTFGYEAEHYALSQAVGELKVLPAVRAVQADARTDCFAKAEKRMPRALVVSTGSACKMQIEQGANVKVTHPIELVWKAILDF